MDSEKSNSSIQWCKACIRIFPQGAKVCPHCGAPISRFSRFFYVHRNLATVIILLITSGVVVATLITSISQLKMQRELWVEEHRPKMLINVKEVIRSNDTVFVVSAIENYGFQAATKPTMSMHIYDALGNKIGFNSNSWPSLDPGRIYGLVTPFGPNLSKRIQDTFYIEMQMEYGWFKDSSEYKYDASFLLDFDSAASKYNSKIIAEGKIPWR